jgi:hypothetical protein
MRFARQFLVSAAVLTSSSMLAEEVFAESREPQAFAYECRVPSVGTDRCGDADRNVRVGRTRRLSIKLDTIPKDEKDPYCVKFHVYHAVSGEELATSTSMCKAGLLEFVWSNPKEEAIDVYTKVGSNKYSAFTISGYFVIDRP